MPDYHCAFCFIKEIINTGTGNQNIRSEIKKNKQCRILGIIFRFSTTEASCLDLLEPQFFNTFLNSLSLLSYIIVTIFTHALEPRHKHKVSSESLTLALAVRM